MSNIKINLTEKEADELLNVARNGYADGDFYNINEATGKGQGYGDKSERDAFLRAFKKIAEKLNLKNTEP